MSTFSVDNFIDACLGAMRETDQIGAIKDVVSEAMSRPDAVGSVLRTTSAELQVLFESEDLTVMKAVWSPSMALPPHNHLMWGAIGVYGGVEDNRYFRRTEAGISSAGGKELGKGDVALLGADIIHSVTNPHSREFTGAIHVYAGDFMHKERSVWPGEPPAEQPATGTTMQRYFEEANATLPSQ